ncbi:hypothetical protein K3495_g8928 [Podosphaera aphanis]|nr:hypothetical protein K3495_g8928 [Podosphaera aphanis]
MYNLRKRNKKIVNKSQTSKSFSTPRIIRTISEDGYPLTDPRSSIWKDTTANFAVVLPCQKSRSNIEPKLQRPKLKKESSLDNCDVMIPETESSKNTVIEKGKDSYISPIKNTSQISLDTTLPRRDRFPRLSSSRASDNCIFELPKTDIETHTASNYSESDIDDDNRSQFVEHDNLRDEDYVEIADDDSLKTLTDSVESEIEDELSSSSKLEGQTPDKADISPTDHGPETSDPTEVNSYRSRSSSTESNCKKRKKTPSTRKTKPSSSKKYFDSWSGYKLGFDASKAPLTTIDEIFEHLTGQFVSHPLFTQLIKHLNGRPLRIATMCSGTECPIIAIDFIRDILAKSGHILNFDHVFSAEIEPFKQAYISRNYPDLLVFRDICELARSYTADKMATTALGALASVPENIDLLITGFCCVDFSNLNNNPKTLLERGESGDTFCAAVAFIMKGKPKIVIFENVSGAPWSDEKLRKDQKVKIRNQYQKSKSQLLTDSELDDLYETLVREERISEGIDATMEKAGYSCQLIKIDTKDYYLPQTRQRGYMICVHNDIFRSTISTNDQNIIDKAKNYLEKVANCILSFKHPATVSCETMLLAVADETAVPIERLEEIDEEKDKNVAWVRSAEEHTRYRSDLGLGSCRKLTFWSETGWKMLPDFYTHMKAFTERVLDCLEIAHLRNIQRGFDDRYYSRLLELSQNCFRATDITKTGIMPCLTPSGIPFWSSGGRRFTGRETLTLQGIPVHRIDLSFLTESHLRDLTGNAMSSTAVGVCIISSLLIFSKYLEPGDGSCHVRIKDSFSNFSHEDDLHQFEMDPEAVGSTISTSKLLEYARMSVKLCWCEKKDEILNRKFKICSVCCHTICQLHAGNPKHEYKILSLNRVSPFTFERLLRRALPKKINLHSLANELKSANFLPKKIPGFETNELENSYIKTLQSEMWLITIKRSDIWEVIYESLLAKYILHISATKIEWLLYAKPSRKLAVEHPVRQHFEKFPIARMNPEPGDVKIGLWEFWVPEKHSVSAKIEWIGKLSPSFKNDRGLIDDEDVKIFSTWRIQAEKENKFPDISGDYHLRSQCGRAMNSLHVREETKTQPRLFLFLDHEKKTGDFKKHCYIFSQDARDLEYGVSRTIIARLPASIGEPEVKRISTETSPKYMTYRMHPLQKSNNFEDSELTNEPPILSADKIKVTIDGFWRKISKQKLSHSDENSNKMIKINYGCLKNPKVFEPLNTDSCQRPRVVFTCKTIVPAHIANLFSRGVWNSVSTKNARDVYYNLSGFLLDGLIILDYVEEKEVWHQVQISDRNRCARCAPEPPPILWHLNAKQMPKPFEHLAHASEYEKNLKSRPATMSQVFLIDDKNMLIFKVGINFQSLIHRATSAFRFGEITASWRLITDNFSMTRPPMPKFKIKTTLNLTPIRQWENKKFPLRLEQRRSVAWQVMNENTTEAFLEEEIVEDGISQLGYQVLLKASRQKLVLGGLLAHEVGFGKTVIILALIDHQTKIDREWGERPSTKRIYSKATVIFVPLSLTTQWLNEVKKFLPAITNVITIRSMKDLRKYTIDQIRNADIIIVNCNILQNDGYLFDLSQFSGMLSPDWMSSSRAKKSWHDTAMKSISESLGYLIKNTPDLAPYLNQKLYYSNLEAQKTERPYPSKRYTGRQYIERKKTKKYEEENLTKLSAYTHSGSRKHNVTSKKEVLLENNYPTKVEEWTSMTHVVFEMFSFARVVVDEYHYLTPGQTISISAIEGRCRWLLSATPLLDTFEQFKQIGELLGVYLGREDYSTMAPEIFKSRVSDMTVSERFLAFDKPSSPAWLRARYKQMQQFLDAFVRKDIAIISAFDIEEKVHLVHQPVAERAFYLELEQLLADNQFQIQRTRGNNSDGEYQTQLALRNYKFAEQALLNAASFYNVQAYSIYKKSARNSADTIEIPLRNRKLDLKAMKENISRDLRRAEWLQGNFTECSNISNYKSFKISVKNIGIKDGQTSRILQDLLYQAEKNVESYDWRQDFLEIGESASTQANASNLMLPYPTGFIQDQGKRVSAPIRYLRTITSSLDNAIKRLTKLVRALRYTENVKACYDLSLSRGKVPCQKCSLPLVRPNDALVLGSCGHLICGTCVSNIAGYCPVEMCGAAFQVHQLFSGNEFVVPHQSREMEEFGTKTADLMRYLKNVPEDEKVLLFVQEESAIEKLLVALRKAELSHVFLGGRNTASIIENFQKGRPMSDTSDGPKIERSILILNIGDSSAAGSNLTIANHVIFFAPYFTTGTSALQKFNHAMEQGVGRAVRYGQKKKVFITHFLTSRTHDVDLFEHRKSCYISTSGSSNPNQAIIVAKKVLPDDLDNDKHEKTEHSSLTWYLHEHL